MHLHTLEHTHRGTHSYTLSRNGIFAKVNQVVKSQKPDQSIKLSKLIQKATTSPLRKSSAMIQ